MKKSLITLIALLFAVTTFAQESEVRIPSGYQGFLEQGTMYQFYDGGHTMINLSTTHGFYFNGHVFVGIGVGVDFNNDYAIVPFYSAIHYVFNNQKNVSPVARLRVGSFLGDGMGAYADLGFGVRFASKRDFAVSIMLNGTYYGNMTKEYYSYEQQTNTTFNPSGVSLRVGIEW